MERYLAIVTKEVGTDNVRELQDKIENNIANLAFTLDVNLKEVTVKELYQKLNGKKQQHGG